MNYKSILQKNEISLVQKFYYIDTNLGGRRLAIGDIHGCSETFLALLDKIALTKNDQLFLLGDFVNKGKNSKGVVDTLLDLIRNDYQIFPLRGNHEQMLLERHERQFEDKKERNLPGIFRAKGIVESKKILPNYLPFFSFLPYYYELDKFYLVHGGFDFSTAKPLENYEQMLLIRDFEVDNQVVGTKTIIHGHTIKSLIDIKNDIEKRKKNINLDNGCVYRNMDLMGNLLCLDLDSFELYVQMNIDF